MPFYMLRTQNGMILVLSMFMLALLSMIGIASMMTTTTDIEIATGERQHVETFYRAQSAHTIAAEIVLGGIWDRGLGGFDTIDPDGDPVDFSDVDDYTFAFRIIDPGLLLEDYDSVRKTITGGHSVRVWQADDQSEDELPCPPDMSDSECDALDASIGTQQLDRWSDMRLIGMRNNQEVVLADIDVDIIDAFNMPGSSDGFGSKDIESGQLRCYHYNIDVRARLSTGNFDRSPSRQAFGLRNVR